MAKAKGTDPATKSVNGTKAKAAEAQKKETSTEVDVKAKRKMQADISNIVGQVAALMQQSPLHRHFFLGDLDWVVVPSVLLKQFRIFQQDGRPVAYASWAYLSEETEERLIKGGKKLRPDEWKGGDKLWLIDLVAPFGGEKEIVQELREKVFKGEKVRAVQPAPDGSGLAVVEW